MTQAVGGRPPLITYDEVTSTQDVAKALLHDAPHTLDGTAVFAKTQTAARGRRSRHWAAHHDGVWMSVIVKRPLPMHQAARLGLVVAAGVCTALRAEGLRTFIKWPNDLLIRTTQSEASPSSTLGPFRKVAGLLVEVMDTDTRGSGPVVSACVVGVGVNLDGPGDADLPHAGGLRDVDDGAFIGEEGRQRLARLIQDVVIAARVDDDAFADARAVCVDFTATVSRRVSVDGVTGVAVAINDDGSLAVRDDDGAVHAIVAGDVVVSPP